MNNFWKDIKTPFFVLAPMEAVTDIVFRQVVAKASRPDIFFSEFVNTASFCSPKGKVSTKSRLAFEKSELPLVGQIWGTDPEDFSKMSQSLAKQGYSGIDINMGCPDKSVVKNGSGSGLIGNFELVKDIVQSTKVGGLPVSIKTRLGNKNIDEYQAWIGFLLNQDIANLTIHLRTRKEMSKVPAHYELIPEIIKLRDKIAPKTLITINGDVENRRQGLILARTYGCDGVMIGRGVFNNPWAFEKEPKEHSLQEKIELLNYQLDLHDYYQQKLGERKFDPLKHFFKVYINGFDGSKKIRQALMQTKNTNQVRDILCHVKIGQ